MEVEICTNVEYVRENILDAARLDAAMADAAADEWSIRAFGAVFDLGLEPVKPGGNRGTCGGWAGARGWSKCGRGWGTFDDCDEATERRIDDSLCEVTEKIYVDFATPVE